MHQPYASLIALGAKSVETRGWNTSYRGPIAIHAAASIPSYLGLGRVSSDRPNPRVTIGRYDIEKDGPGELLLRGASLAWPYRLPFGAIVATAQLVDVVATTAITWGTTGPAWEPSCGEEYPRCRVHVHREQQPYGDYSPGRYAWLLSDVKPVRRPVPQAGMQGLWTVPDELAQKLLGVTP